MYKWKVQEETARVEDALADERPGTKEWITGGGSGSVVCSCLARVTVSVSTPGFSIAVVHCSIHSWRRPWTRRTASESALPWRRSNRGLAVVTARRTGRNLLVCLSVSFDGCDGSSSALRAVRRSLAVNAAGAIEL